MTGYRCSDNVSTHRKKGNQVFESYNYVGDSGVTD